MKLFLFSIALILFILPTDKSVIAENEVVHSINGAWKLDSFYYYENNKISDTIATTEGYRQIKMYTNDKVMWTRYVPTDSVEWFGYGNYELKDDQLIETLEYGSASMMRIIDTMRVFTFKIELGDDRFSQITLDEDGNRFSSENYVRIE